MKFNPQQYSIPDRPQEPFLDPGEIEQKLREAPSDAASVRAVLARSLSRQRLSLDDVAVLLNVEDEALVREIKATASLLKEAVYGNRIVLFAPFYVGNLCSNNCRYCGFRSSNREAVRKTLSEEEVLRNVEALEDNGHKRLILVFGEHTEYSPRFIADTVRKVYSVRKGNGEIRRVNINAAPLDIEGFRTVREAGIGTYQVFQETYHPGAYARWHAGGKKADYGYRLTALDRAMEAGIDDVGIGVLFGLYDWRFEVMGLIRHVNHLEACFNVGPHTISFPRLQAAADAEVDERFLVSDEDFVRIIAILRLAVPYTGMILTAREPESVRREVLQYGCSQVDAGTRLELGAYAAGGNGSQDLRREQFLIRDNRSLDEVIAELVDQGLLPSFCTACYRKGRTGEHFMEFSVPGFIKRYCTPNAILTLAEYLEDYAPESTRMKGWELIGRELQKMEGDPRRADLAGRIERVKSGERDLYY